MIEVGRVCIKLAGRDAKQYCVVTEVIDNTYVMIDGQTRRKRCNIKHLEPLNKLLKIKAKASHEDVKTAFKELNVEIKEHKKKDKKTAKPIKKRTLKGQKVKEKKAPTKTSKPKKK